MNILMVSGGKDSTAMACWAQEHLDTYTPCFLIQDGYRIVIVRERCAQKQVDR